MDRKSSRIANSAYFREVFPTEKETWERLEEIKWNGCPVCPWCGSLNAGRWRSDRPEWWRCRECRKQLTAKHNTIFACTKMPLLAWFEVWYSMMQHGGISMKVAEDIGAVQETAWLMTHKIREALRSHKDGMMLGGHGIIVEIDEAFPGGLERFKHYKDRLFPGKGYGGKKGLISIVERGDSGRRITVKLPDKWVRNKKGKKIKIPDVSEKVVREIILRHVKPGTVAMTDSSDVYDGLKALGYEHHSVNHKRHQYVVKLPDNPAIGKAHTNTVESSHRGVKTRHRNHVHYSRKHAQRYYDETDFYWNNARVFKEKKGILVFAKRRAPTVEAFEEFLRGCLGKTLSYKQLTGKYRNPKKRRKRRKAG